MGPVHVQPQRGGYSSRGESFGDLPLRSTPVRPSNAPDPWDRRMELGRVGPRLQVEAVHELGEGVYRSFGP